MVIGCDKDTDNLGTQACCQRQEIRKDTRVWGESFKILDVLSQALIAAMKLKDAYFLEEKL